MSEDAGGASAVIIVEKLIKRFGDFVAVNGVSFTVPRGQVFGFLGPNGAGKTTVIRILLGLLQPTSGAASVLGYQLPREAKSLHARVGYMSQSFTLYDELTARENIRFYGRVYGLSRAELSRRSQEILAMAGLVGREHELAHKLSGGWRQRLALGCAIIHQPELLFLDEPTAGVDPVSRREFWRLIYELAERNTTIFVTTHYMDEAERCQRLGFVNQGELVALGSPAELKETQMSGQVIEVVSDNAEQAARVLRAAAARGALDAQEVALYGALVHVVATEVAPAQAQIRQHLTQAGITLLGAEVIPPSLEDVFISCVRRRDQPQGSKS